MPFTLASHSCARYSLKFIDLDAAKLGREALSQRISRIAFPARPLAAEYVLLCFADNLLYQHNLRRA